MKIAIIVQARLGSKRFPEKILKKINNRFLIEILVERLMPQSLKLTLF